MQTLGSIENSDQELSLSRLLPPILPVYLSSVNHGKKLNINLNAHYQFT
jgi:hypothetical protein